MATTEKGIYYPNDGTKVADILTDMKKMAGSIDEVIGENEFDPSQLNQSITDLQQNVTNLQESQTAQDNEINQIKGTLTNKETEIAKNIHIEDAEGFGKLSILGNHEQNGEPSEENPVEIKCLGDNKKNLFSLDNKLENAQIDYFDETIENSSDYDTYYIELEEGQSFVLSLKFSNDYYKTAISSWGYLSEIPVLGASFDWDKIGRSSLGEINNKAFTAKRKYFVISILREILPYIYDIQVEKGTVATSFVPYGQGSTEIKIENSDKTQELTYVLSIQQEMLKGDYFLKELDIWKEVHNWQKIDSYNGENITTDYISTTSSLTTGATVFYKLQTPKKIPCTEEQSKILNQLNALDLFEGVNDITTTENIALLQLKYVSNVDEIDILEQEIEKLNTTKVDKVPGKGLSTEDYTTEEKQKLAGLTNYDDTEIKEDIAKIQEEQTTQNQKIEKIEDNQIHIKTEQSSTINVQDCSNLSAKIDVFGVSNQETRSGKNLVDISILAKELANGISYTYKNDKIHIEGTATAIAPSNVANVTDKLEIGKKYILSLNKSNNDNVIATTSIQYNDETPQAWVNSFTFSENMKTVNVYLQVANGATVNTDVTVQLEEGEVATEYEKYGASPSPEYPSEIKNLSGDIEITVCNKNFFDEDFSQGYDSNGNIVTSSQFVCNTNLIDVIENESYTISNNLNLKIASVAYYKDNEFVSFQANLNLATITIPQNVNQIRFNFYKEPTLNISDFIYCQFEKNVVATDYIEHEEQIKTFPLKEGQKMYEGSYTANDGIHHVRTQDNNVSGTSKTFSNAKENGKYMCNVKESGTLNGKTITFETSVTNAIVEYELAEEETEAYTEAQQEAYNQLQNVTPYKLVTNISTDKAKLQFNYIADTKTYVDNEINSIKEQLKTVNELLSTTKTSAMLLDNMQTDLESEVL